MKNNSCEPVKIHALKFSAALLRKLRAPASVRVLCFLMMTALPATGQGISFETSQTIDWVRAEMNSQVTYNLAQAGIKLPSGRFYAEEILRDAFPGLIRPFILSLRIDSNSTLKDMIDKGEISLEELDGLCRESDKIPPSLSPDLTRMAGRYTVLLDKISSLVLSRYGPETARQRRVTEAHIPLFPVPTADYTGIIIIADNELPVRGRRDLAYTEPCLFPRIWDTSMNLVYDRNMFESGGSGGNIMARYTRRESILRPTPSGLDGDLSAILGNNPLRVFAREVFGIYTTDPVIDREDAMRILSSENNRRLLREGRVALVLNAARLRLDD